MGGKRGIKDSYNVKSSSFIKVLWTCQSSDYSSGDNVLRMVEKSDRFGGNCWRSTESMKLLNDTGDRMS